MSSITLIQSYFHALEESCSEFDLNQWDIDYDLLSNGQKLKDFYIPLRLSTNEAARESLGLEMNSWLRLNRLFSQMNSDAFDRSRPASSGSTTLSAHDDCSLPFDQQLENFITSIDEHLSFQPPIALSYLLHTQGMLHYREYQMGMVQDNPGFPADLPDVSTLSLFRPSSFDPAYTNMELLEALKEFDGKPVGPIISNLPSRKVILSDPGGGKTTYMKRIALAYATEDHAFLKELSLPETLFPVFLDCNYFDQEMVSNGRGFLSAAVQMLIQTLESPAWDEKELLSVLSQKASQGTLLLLIDNLDTMHNQQNQASFSTCFADYLLRNKNVHTLIAARMETFANFNTKSPAPIQTILSIPFLRYHRLLPLVQEEIDAFVRCWYRNLFSHNPESAETAEFIVQQLHSPAFTYLKTMTGVPLQLTKLLAVTANTQCIPYDKRRLYDDYINLVLERRPSKTVRNAHLKLILAYIASYIRRTRVPDINHDELVFLIQFLTKHEKSLQGLYDDDIILAELNQCPGILEKLFHIDNIEEPADVSYQFVNSDFLDYLTAYAFAEQCSYAYTSDPWSPTDFSDSLADHAGHIAWHEVITFYALQLNHCRNVSGRNYFIASILSDAEEFDNPSNYNHLLFQLIASGIPMKTEKKHRIYDHFFHSPMTGKKLDTLLSFLSDPRSEECKEYLTETFQKDLSSGNDSHPLAAAIMTAHHCIQTETLILPVAEALIQNGTDMDVALGFDLVRLLGWCSYSYVKHSALHEELLLSHSLLERLNHCIFPDKTLLPFAARALKEILLATSSYDALVSEQQFFQRIVQMLDNDSSRSFAEEILSVFPLSVHSAEFYKTAEVNSLKDMYLPLYRAQMANERNANLAVFTFSICALLGCWSDSYNQLLMEFTDLEAAYQIWEQEHPVTSSLDTITRNLNPEELVDYENALSTHHGSRRRLQMLRKQVYDMAP